MKKSDIKELIGFITPYDKVIIAVYAIFFLYIISLF